MGISKLLILVFPGVADSIPRRFHFISGRVWVPPWVSGESGALLTASSATKAASCCTWLFEDAIDQSTDCGALLFGGLIDSFVLGALLA
jgi:hypothetical protein